MNKSDFVDFFSALHLPDDIVEIRAIRPNKEGPLPRSKWHTAAEWLDGMSSAWLEQMNQDGWGIYAGVLPRTTHGVRGDENTLPGSVVWADIDHVAIAQAGQILADSKVPHPSIIVNSGHGVQCYWLLTEKYAPKVLCGLVRDIGLHLNSDPAVKNPERVLRVPGFVNHKPPVADAELLECHHDLLYEYEQLRQLIPEAATLIDWNRRNAAIVPDVPDDVIARRAWGYIDKVEGAGEGGRNMAGYRVAAILVKDYTLSDGLAMDLLRKWDSEKNSPPIGDENELASLIIHARKYGKKQEGFLLAAETPQDDGFDVDSMTVNSPVAFDEEEYRGAPTRIADPGPFPDHLFNVPGLIGDFSQYINRRANKPQPVISLAVAIVAMGALAGRKVEGITGLRTNIYAVSVAETGTGKNAPREELRNLLMLASDNGEREINIIDRLGSDAGIRSALGQNPNVALVLDEIGEHLEAIKNSKNSPWVKKIIPELMTLYSSAASRHVKLGGLGDVTKNVTVDCPHLCLYGTSTSQSVFNSMTMQSVSSGFIGRLLLFETSNNNPRQQKPSREALPQSVMDAVDFWKTFKPNGDLTGNHAGSTSDPLIIEESDEATAAFDEYENIAREEIERYGNQWMGIYNRVQENARKLALVHACSSYFKEPFVSEESARWGCELALYLTRRLVYLGSFNIADNEFHDRRNKVLQSIIEAGEKGRTQSQLINSFRSIKAREMGEIIDTLVMGKDVIAASIKTKTKTKNLFFANNRNNREIIAAEKSTQLNTS